MGRYCSDCENMNLKDKKCDGLYKCKATKKYVFACQDACDKFENNYGMSSFDKEKYYDLGRKATKSSDTLPGTELIFILILFGILIICGLIFK
jgi:peptide methionine sulfoxide reductase MsrB